MNKSLSLYVYIYIYVCMYVYMFVYKYIDRYIALVFNGLASDREVRGLS